MKTDKEWEARARELVAARPGANDGLMGPMLQLGREMQADVLEHARDVLMPAAASQAADERAEEIAQRIVDGLLPSHPDSYVDATDRAARIARSTITKPKTREQALEEALREIRDDHDMDHLAESRPHHNCVLCRAKAAARRALEWKP